MKAVRCVAFGPPELLVVEDVPSPVAGAGQVLIDVKACGVNFPDTLIIAGKYQFRPDPPFTPGGEVAGVIRAVGPGVSDFQPGDRVVAIAPFGGYAEEVCASATTLVRMPDGLDFVPAACALTAYGTGYHALRDRAAITAGETLLVLGAAGGVGLAAVELGKMFGARVIAAASSAEKLQLCRERGADEVIDYASEDLKERVKALTGGKGADVIYDPVGGSFTEAALRAIAWNGRLLVVGFASGDIPKIPANLTLLKGCSVVGVFWGSFATREPDLSRKEHEEILRLVLEGKLRPHISATFPLAKAGEALRIVADRRVHGKIALTT